MRGRVTRPVRLWLAAALILPVAPLIAVATAPAAIALGNGLALTPPMGWNDWNAYGCNVSEQLVEQTALAMRNNGMQAAGYQYVSIGDCWMASSRNASGDLVPDSPKFPGGMAAVATYVHLPGLKLGIYEDAGTATCAGFPGSYGHETQDANLFVSWGVDYLKYDWCNIPFSGFPNQAHQQAAQTLYTRIRNALSATGRPIVFSMCNGWDSSAQPWSWAGPVSSLWRTSTGILASFSSLLPSFHTNVALAGTISASVPAHGTVMFRVSGGSSGIVTSGEIHAAGAAKCLDVPNSTQANGTQLQIWDCNGGANQQWLLNVNGTITGVQSGLCLDVTGASTADGALVELWTCNGQSNQQWSLV